MKNIFSRNHVSLYRRAFLILALIFLIVGFGTLGSPQSVGKSYRLPMQRTGDGMAPAITLYLSEPGHGEENHVHRDLYIKKIFVNVGTVYNEYGKSATLRLGYGSSTSSKFYTYIEYPVPNLYSAVKKEGSDELVSQTENALFNWASVELDITDGYRLANYPYWKLTAIGGDIIVNEVVFVANEKDESGKDIIVNAAVYTQLTNLAESEEDVVKKAGAVVDRQHAPSLAESSYFKYMPEEVASLSTCFEMRLGSGYGTGNVNHMDRIYSPFGLDMLFLGPLIFGFSPFGFRFMPMLASFGILIFAFLIVKKLTGSEKAAFFSSLLYALCGMSLSLAHFATPLMIGVFFFTAALYFCLSFFLEGMKQAKLRAAAPVVLTALFAAFSVCTNGAFLVPVLGLCALFAAGVVRQRRKLFAQISLEAEQAIEEENNENNENNGGQTSSEGRKKVAKLLSDANYIRTVSVVLFCAILALGFFLISILAILPLYQTFVKVLDDPANPQKSIFYFLFTAFLGGFVGDNGVVNLSSPFRYVYLLFCGAGENRALTAAGALVSVAPLLFGAIGLIWTLVKLCQKKRSVSAQNYSLIILLIGFAICIVMAAFAKGGLGFLLLGELFLFAFAALPLCESGEETENGKAAQTKKKAWLLCGIVISAVCFVLFGALTFSIPLPGPIVNLFL